MKKIDTIDAVGHVLSHDITEIIPGKFKGRAFKKGHIIKEEDVEKLLRLGKDHVYILEMTEEELHEDDAALILGDMGKGENIYLGEDVKEGKVEFFAAIDGLLKVDVEKLFQLNMIGQMSFATLTQNIPVKKGEKVAAARVIPLVIKKDKMEQVKGITENKLINVRSFKKKNIGIVSTGNEVYYGRIEDKFGPVVESKVKAYGCDVMEQIIVPDDKEMIKKAIKTQVDNGAEIVMCTGGMSVDPDDITPSAIIELGGELVTYGSPVLPGSMFLLSYLNEVPVMGLPGCVMYCKKTVFDLVLPRVLAEEKLTVEDIMGYGHGGLCQDCEICRYPNCSFGK